MVRIRRANLLGSGGQGSIYAIPPGSRFVAKVLRDPQAPIGAKLKLMVENPPPMLRDKGHPVIAWPEDTLHSDWPPLPENTVGYIMRRALNMQPLTQCFNPSSRSIEFPHFTYQHLSVIAANIAQAFARLHGLNYVVGDINESNILVDDRGMITLIDTDSFQLVDEETGQIYRSPVGKPEFTPGELQGRRFDTVDRDQYHDRFGLAVLIFQLLLEGRHPFSGVYQGQGPPPTIETCIASGFFPYSARAVPLKEAAGFLPLHMLPAEITRLFHLAFDSGHDNRVVRPTAFRWYEALLELSRNLKTCDVNPNHRFCGHRQTCFWCDRAILMGGHDPFPRKAGPQARSLADGLERALARSPHKLLASAKPRDMFLVMVSNFTSFGNARQRRAGVLIGGAGMGFLACLLVLLIWVMGGNDSPIEDGTAEVADGTPDLTIRNLMLSPEGLTVSVGNFGASSLVTFAVGVYMNGLADPVAVISHRGEIDAGRDTSLTVPFPIPADCHEFYAIVDLENQVREAYESNNRSLSFTICQDDLDVLPDLGGGPTRPGTGG